MKAKKKSKPMEFWVVVDKGGAPYDVSLSYAKAEIAVGYLEKKLPDFKPYRIVLVTEFTEE